MKVYAIAALCLAIAAPAAARGQAAQPPAAHAHAHAAPAAAQAAAAEPQEDVKTSPACRYCGMDRQKFGSSRMVIVYDDGSRVGTCSIHCAAVDLANNLDKSPTALLVGDQPTQTLVDAEKASWVLGGDLPGVMTKRAKWAFADRAAAEAFAKARGGTLIGFDEAMKATYEDMYQDTRMIRERRKAKRQKAAEAAAPPAAAPKAP